MPCSYNRPPPSKKNKLTTPIFFEQFSQLIETLMEDCTHPLVITGDFNFHLDDLTSPDALKFVDLLDSVKDPTNRRADILD